MIPKMKWDKLLILFLVQTHVKLDQISIEFERSIVGRVETKGKRNSPLGIRNMNIGKLLYISGSLAVRVDF